MFWTGSGDSNMLFDLHIMGGNLASTLAGEYSFMIAVGFALFFLGAFARALDGRRNLWLPAVLLAATMTSHLVVAIFAVLGAAILWLARRPHRTVLRAAIVVAVGGLLAALWSLPLATTLGYTTDMRYDPVQVSDNSFHWLFPPRSGGFELFGMGALWYLYPLAIAAIVGGIVHRRRVTLEVAGLTAVAGFVFYHWEGIRHTLGKAPAWNLRLLPFWFVMLYLLAALGAAELARWAGSAVGWVVDQYRRDRAWTDWEERVGARPEPPGAADATSEVGMPSDEPADTASPPAGTVVTEPLPNPPRSVRRPVRVVGIAVLAVVAVVVTLWRINDTRSFLPYWAKYNYSG